ncbi:hypothetical protein BH10ACI4_BH10ACI4_10990 [soil metagenome]
MPSYIKSLLALLLLLGGLTSPRAWGQVAPYNDPSMPTDFPDPGTSLAGTRVAAQGAPIAVIRGWSFRSELDRNEMLHGNEVSLDPGHPEIILFFDATPMVDGKTEFRYRLNDYDADWTLTRGRMAHYRRLPPGRYRFEVQARIAGQQWGTQEAILPVQQKPFFYQTWYSYLLVGLVLLAIAAQLLHQRDQLLKGQMGMVLEERNRIASECHDTLMAGFAAISWQLEATAKLFRNSGAGEDPAAQSCELARSMVAHCQAEARRIIWDLRDSDEITNSLSRALLDATSTHRQRESPQTTLDIQGKEIPISPAAVHHLVCIGQEAVSNAIRHAGSSRIAIELRYESDLLRLTVRDDGRGFHASDHSARTGHFGIPVMEERARKLGGALHLTSSVMSGTEVAVTVSFHKIHQTGIQQQHIMPWIGV